MVVLFSACCFRSQSNESKSDVALDTSDLDSLGWLQAHRGAVTPLDGLPSAELRLTLRCQSGKGRGTSDEDTPQEPVKRTPPKNQ